AHKFGFVIRYTKEKESITGYRFEPWHVRYVGNPQATYLYENQLTLEEVAQ
ncbi:D-alanyl-D-alanine carboxypeptidase family protein, partial [Bacillus sp. B-TM1]